MLDRLIDLLKPEFKKAPITIVKRYQGAALFVRADPVLLEGVFINLFKNAAEALTGQNQGEISIGIDKDHYTIHISDNGPGVDKEALDKIFIPFYTTKKGGSGIGLSISKKIMALHKGSIHVESISGGGATFQLRLKAYN